MDLVWMPEMKQPLNDSIKLKDDQRPLASLHLIPAQSFRGPTTIILPVKKGIIHPSIMGEDGTLGIRIPAHPFGPKLCDKLGFPITTTSVNRSGQDPFNDPDEIIDEFDGEFDLLIDDGVLPQSSGSTIYKLEKSKLKVIRP